MSVNLLGDSKRHRITAAIKLPVLRAWVLSHSESGRWAYLTIGWTKDHHYHRHAWFDRRTGEWDFAPNGAHNTSCHELFPGEIPATLAEHALLALFRALGEKR